MLIFSHITKTVVEADRVVNNIILYCCRIIFSGNR